MKTLLLADDTYRLMLSALEDSPDGREVLRRFNARAQMPDDRQLIAADRAGDEAPVPIAQAVERRDAARGAGEETRDAVLSLLLDAYDAGVRPVTLRKWFRLSEPRLFQILSKHREGQEAQHA